MIQIFCKTSGVIIQTEVSNWRTALTSIKSWSDNKVWPKSSDIIRQIKAGYEDEYLQVQYIPGNWRCN